ncbi:hypothetical protein [Aquimonas sp.]|jgi:hypothetical protein|uniref:hypothetical protein n=1 Tax=Aquimonas sp. TaxID=1872588 RepID=UPI0037BFAEE0
MGILDELKQEAERRRTGEHPVMPEEPKEGLWSERLGPAAQRLYEFLKQLSTHLNELKKRVRVVYNLPGYGDVVAYIEAPYTLKATPGSDSVEITLECAATVATEECATLETEGVLRTQSLTQAFTKHRLSGLQESKKNANGEVVAGRFLARGRVPLTLHVEAGQALGVARITLTNFYGFATTIRSFRHAQLTPELFDSLGRYLTHEDAGFGRENVDEDVRRTLAAKVQREQTKRRIDQDLGEQSIEDEERVRALMAGGGVLKIVRKLLGR